MIRSILCVCCLYLNFCVFSQDKLDSIETATIEKGLLNLGNDLKISNDFVVFLKDRSKVLFYLEEKKVTVLPKSVDVYSYTDVKMQDEQLRDADIPGKYAFLFDFNTSRLIRLEQEGQKLVADYSGGISDIQINDEYALLYDFKQDIFTYDKNGDIIEKYTMSQYVWNKGLTCDLYMISLNDGTRKLIKEHLEPTKDRFPYVRFSKDGKSVVYEPSVEKIERRKQPDKKEGTINTELISWIAFDGKQARGVLAKPKDFDPKKKYPIIFIYYENSIVKHPEDRPYGIGDFVDYGYLVFSPDIEYTIGKTGTSVFNYVVSAAEHLKKLSYVDAKRMGIKGASFGGYETNYLVTHSNLFAAAISMSGYSDFISNIGAMNNGQRPHGLEGTDQNRLGVTMWQRPDIWIKNSPIFYADRVTAPLLLIHSKSDDNVPFEQSLAFFRALRSFGKRSWLLQYDDAGHIAVTTSIVGKPYGNCDFCTRQLQFFNHYLKGEPAPLWMLEGIPARLKGIKTGLELDTLGRTPGPGLRKEKITLTDQQEALLKKKTMVTDDGRIINVPQKTKQINK